MAPGLKLFYKLIGMVITFFMFNAILVSSFNPYKFIPAAASMALLYTLVWFVYEFFIMLVQLDINEMNQTEEEEKF